MELLTSRPAWQANTQRPGAPYRARIARRGSSLGKGHLSAQSVERESFHLHGVLNLKRPAPCVLLALTHLLREQGRQTLAHRVHPGRLHQPEVTRTRIAVSSCMRFGSSCLCPCHRQPSMMTNRHCSRLRWRRLLAFRARQWSFTGLRVSAVGGIFWQTPSASRLVSRRQTKLLLRQSLTSSHLTASTENSPRLVFPQLPCYPSQRRNLGTLQWHQVLPSFPPLSLSEVLSDS